MEDLQRETELAVGQIGMGDVERARAEPRRQAPAPAEELEEIVLAAEDQRAFAGIDPERHADAIADIFLETGRTGEALGRMDDLREALGAGVKSRPDVAAHPFRHGHDAGDPDVRGMGIARDRQRSADETRGLRQQPAGPAHPGVEDFARVDHGASTGEALAEAAADRERQRGPVLVAHQRAEADIAQLGTDFGFRLGCRLESGGDSWVGDSWVGIGAAVDFESEGWRAHGALLAY